MAYYDPGMTDPRLHYRLGVNQPAHSPTARRLAEMAEAIGRDTDGDFRLDVFPDSRLGAEPGMVPFSGMYEALKAKTFDGQSDPLGVVQSLRLDEVQTYLSLTGHWWSGFTLLAYGAAWQALPREIQAVVERNTEHFAKLQRRDVEAVNAAGEAELARRGMIVNHAETESIRGRLGDFYARCGRASTPQSGP